MRLHPSDIMALKAQGKTAADMPLRQRLGSQLRNLARTTKRDIRGQVRAHRLRTNKKLLQNVHDLKNLPNAINLARLGDVNKLADGTQKKLSQRKFGIPSNQVDALLKKGAAAHGQLNNRLTYLRNAEKAFGKRNALRLGGAILGTAVGLKGIHSYRKWRKKSKEKTQYRDYEVYPEHNYAAVPQQTYNQPYYNEDREELINLIVESLYY